MQILTKCLTLTPLFGLVGDFYVPTVEISLYVTAVEPQLCRKLREVALFLSDSTQLWKLRRNLEFCGRFVAYRSQESGEF